DEVEESAGRRSPALVGPLREWLERALDVSGGFGSALEASDSLSLLSYPRERIAIEGPRPIEELQVSPIQVFALQNSQVTDMAFSSSVESTESLATHHNPWAETPTARFSIVRNVAIGLAVLVMVEGAMISRLMTRATPAAAPVADVPLTIES